MSTQLSLVQFSATSSKQQNLHQIESLLSTCASAGSKMVFFPEYSMGYAHRRDARYFGTLAEPIDGVFVSRLQTLAAQLQIWIACGVFEQTAQRPYNTIVVINAQGTLVGTHRKNKLYDAFGAQESAECMPGSAPFSPIDTPIGRLGIITCYELRFPSLAAHAKAQGADCLLVPAGWMAGEHKLLHWETLLRARAIENQMHVLGVNQAAQHVFTGHTAAYNNNGCCLASLKDAPDVLSLTL